MAKENLSDFNSDSDSDSDSERGESTEKLSEEEEEEEEEEKEEEEEEDGGDDDDDDDDDDDEEEEPRKMAKQVIPDYEKQRLSRMAENKARMEALGLHKMATSLMASPQKSNQSLLSTARKGKRKILDEDDEYRPNDDVSADDLDDDDEHEEDADSAVKSSAKSRRRKPQKKVTTPKNKLPLQKHSKRRDYINEDDDEELMKAISLSLQDLPEKKNANVRDGSRGRKKPPLSSRVKMTEDELILHFFQFDESGKGFLTLRDLQRVSTANDFLWTDEELADMITCFDSDGDGKLNLDEFRKIARRCSMI